MGLVAPAPISSYARGGRVIEKILSNRVTAVMQGTSTKRNRFMKSNANPGNPMEETIGDRQNGGNVQHHTKGSMSGASPRWSWSTETSRWDWMDHHIISSQMSAHGDGTREVESRAQMSAVHNVIAGLENARCRALVDADFETLDRLFSDDLVHVHGNGKVDDKASYMKMMRGQVRFLKAERDRLDVRVYGGIAVATGPLHQSIEMIGTGQRVDMYIMTTQIWRRNDRSWKQVSFQATNLPAEV